jgi:PAT family beta-lactamase induction signal transducer AmpG
MIEPHRTWTQAIAVYLHAPVIAMLFLGFSAGLPFLLVFTTLTGWLRDVGVEVAAIGFFSWIGITYSIKFIWAPIVDRLRLPGLTGTFGQRRSWILLGQVMVASGLTGLALLDPTDALMPVALVALVVAFGSATQDIAVDAFRIESAADDLQAAMAATYVIGYRGGILVAGAGALYIADYVSWSAAYLTMAALMSVGVVTVLLRPEPSRRLDTNTAAREERVERDLLNSAHLPEWWRNLCAWFIGAVVCPFVDFFVRNGRAAITLLVLVGIYKISDLAMAAMAFPLYIDLGFELVEQGR